MPFEKFEATNLQPNRTALICFLRSLDSLEIQWFQICQFGSLIGNRQSVEFSSSKLYLNFRS